MNAQQDTCCAFVLIVIAFIAMMCAFSIFAPFVTAMLGLK